MKKLALAVMLLSGSALASSVDIQNEAGSASNSTSQVLIQNEGTQMRDNSPSMSAPSIGSTGPCTIGVSGGMSVPGFGFSAGKGVMDEECNVRAETHMLLKIVSKDAAILHMCMQDATLASTLTTLGLCPSKQEQVEEGEPQGEPKQLSHCPGYDGDDEIVRMRLGCV